MQLALSTVAMSTYNVMTLAPTPASLTEIYQALCNGHGLEIPKEMFLKAIHSLMARCYLRIHHAHPDRPTDLFECYDPKKRRVRWRDRSEGADGFARWLVEDPRGPMSLDQIVSVYAKSKETVVP